MSEAGTAGHSARYYAGVLRRRGWIVVLCGLIGLNAAWFYSSSQTPMYRSSADIAISSQSYVTGSSLEEVINRDFERFAATQAAIASSPGVAAAAIERSGVEGWTPDELLKRSKVTADPNTSLVNFQVSARDQQQAVDLANAYAEAFAQRSRDLAADEIQALINPLTAKVGQVNQKIAANQETIARNEALGISADIEKAEVRSLQAQLEVLLTQIGTLETQKATLPGTSKIASVATEAVQTAPTTERNLAAGLAIGLVIGIGLAFLREALDTRLRSGDDIAHELGLSLLARIPAPSRKLRKADQLALLSDDPGVDVEAYRKLRVGLDFANLQAHARAIMVTSAVEQEGKSTTIANLAVAMTQVGRHVILVDLDLRRPYLGQFFNLGQIPGVTDVALGNLSLDDALHRIAVTGTRAGSAVDEPSSKGARSLEGTLQVLTAGEQPPDPIAFLESEALGYLMGELKERADVVLIDAPPVLPVSDAMAISGKVDGLILVSRLEVVRRPMLRELRRELDGAHIARLGLVLTGADRDAAYGYGYGYGYGTYASQPAAAKVRPDA